MGHGALLAMTGLFGFSFVWFFVRLLRRVAAHGAGRASRNDRLLLVFVYLVFVRLLRGEVGARRFSR